MTVNPQNAAAQSEYEGVVYYFCATVCKEQFDKNPSQYLSTCDIPAGAELITLMPSAHSAVKLTPKASVSQSDDGNTVYLSITGMHCASCVSRVERALMQVPGVTSAAVNLVMKQATVSVGSGGVEKERLIDAVNELGYQATLISSSPKSGSVSWDADYRKSCADFLVALVLTLPVFIQAMFLMHWYAGNWLGFLLTTAVIVWPGRRFYISAWASAKRLTSDMNTLISVGTLAAYFFSLAVLLLPGLFPASVSHPYFETAAVILTLILFGNMLEAKAKGRASQAIQALMELAPQTARVRTNSHETEVPVDSVSLATLVVVRPGERIPLDGIIREGASALDESLITGESVPVEKKAGDEVISGSMNTFGAFVFEVTRTGPDTTLNQIIRLVREAQALKAPIQRIADRISAFFVPIVLLIALGTFAVWIFTSNDPARFIHALTAAISVLIIACPCALGLATPTAIMVATGRGAQLGIIFRGGESLERAGRIQVVALDKTGTITRGKPVVTDVILKDSSQFQTVISLVASAESGSEHPLGQAIVDYARSQSISLVGVQEFQAVAGAGIKACVEGRSIIAGNLKMMVEEGIYAGQFDDTVSRFASEGKTPVLIALDRQVLGVIGIADELKPEAPDAIKALKDLGLQVLMITGDAQRTAAAIAEAAGITDFRAEVKPNSKAEQIQSLQNDGLITAMVGDGINDSPALVQADVGIAIGAGADIAKEASDITLAGEDLRLVATAIRLSRAALFTIKRNLFFAFAYNVVAIPIAAGALYPFTGVMLNPMIASLAMALSSVSVVTSSLFLKRFR